MKKVLLIDDDTFMQDIVTSRLVNAGYDVAQSYTGEGANELILESAPDLVLLDIDLPGKSGFAILEELRATDTTTPVIIFSNNDDPDIQAKVKQLGAQDFYFKAATGADELLEKVALHLG